MAKMNIKPKSRRGKLRVLLALVMLSGNSAPWTGTFLPALLRLGVPAVAAFLASTGKALARAGNGSPSVHAAVDYRRLALGLDPSDEDLGRMRLFDQPFFPTSGPPVAGENRALAQALRATVDSPSDESLSRLGDFAAQIPTSRWVLAVELNRGLTLYKRGYFSKALDAFQAAWDAGKNESAASNPRAKRLADRALAELIRMNSRVGRMDEMKGLLAQMEGRKPAGVAGRWFEDAKDALWTMENKPDKAFFCGPYALQKILAFQNSKLVNDRLFAEAKSPVTGFSLDKVWKMSMELGMNLQVAKRAPGAKVLLPAVVNWKLGHYAALLEGRNGYFRSEDPTFGSETWISEKALDEESTGYYLVPDGSLPQGWTKVGLEEASKIFGRGYVQGNPPEPPTVCDGFSPSPAARCAVCSGDDDEGTADGSGNPGGCADCGNAPSSTLPQACLDVNLVASIIVAKPLGYKPPIGPAVNIKLTYFSKTALDLPFGNFGDDWSFNWQAFVQYNINSDCPPEMSNLVLVPRDGGQEVFKPNGYTQHTLSFMRQTSTFPDGCEMGMPSGFVRNLRNGWTEEYGLPVINMDNVQILLTKVTDAQGNSVLLKYDDQNRLVSLTDALGQVTSLVYGNNDNMITEITDPFGRSALFNDGGGGLIGIQDQLGMLSTFAYGGNGALSGDWVSSMTTPYGSTVFDYTGSDTDGTHELDITDPQLLKEHARFTQPQTPPDVDAVFPPAGMFATGDDWEDERNTFYWDHKAMADAPFSANSATIFHWFHTPDGQQSNVLESYKKPLESRVWFNYPGQTDSVHENGITEFMPSAVGRFFGDGIGQVTHYTRNPFGLATQSIDPLGRKFNTAYGSNLIDPISVSDSRGEILWSASYNGQHEPSTFRDASGQVWNYQYNSAGQLTMVTSPLKEVTQYLYDQRGYLQSVVPPQPGATVSYTYDQYGRVATSTDAVQGTLNYQYDNGDRLTEVDYPDGTSTRYGYTNLDLTSVTDRENRTTTYAYDLDRRMTSMTDPKNQTTQYGWCACGALASVQNPEGGLTQWLRDLEGRTVEKTYPKGNSERYEYDSGDGRLIQLTDADGQVKGFNYNRDDTLSGIQYAGTNVPTQPVNFQYDPVLPRVTGMLDGTGETDYSYGAFGQLGANRLKVLSGQVGATAYSITYAYDGDGRVVQRSIDNVAETYQYNGKGQLASTTNPLGPFTYSYDPASARLVGVQYPDNLQTQMDYYAPGDREGASGSLKDLMNLKSGGQTLSAFGYQYLAEGEVSTWSKDLGMPSGPSTVMPGYDGDSQVMGVTEVSGNPLKGPVTQVYGYNGDGSVTLIEESSAVSQSSTSFLTDTQDEATTMEANPLPVDGATNNPAAVAVNGLGVGENGANEFDTGVPPDGGDATTPVTVVAVDLATGTVASGVQKAPNAAPLDFDGNGNLLRDDQRLYQWDGEKRLAQVSFLSPPPAGAATVRMAYDGLGRRVGIAEVDGNGNLLAGKTFVWCGNRLCQERDGTGKTVTKQFFPQGEKIGTTSYYFTKDHLGSVREMADANGTVVAQYDYNPYGKQEQLSGNTASDFGYTGFHQEPAAGLDLALYRAYDPTKGKWLSRDPMGEGTDFNLFSYAGNSPFNEVDPSGAAFGEFTAEGFLGGEALFPAGGGIIGGAIGFIGDVLTNPLTWGVLGTAGGAGYFAAKKYSPSSDEGDGTEYKPKTRDKVREKLPKDRQMGGEDTDPWKGKAPKDPNEYEKQRRQIEEDKRNSGIGGAGTTEDAQ